MTSFIHSLFVHYIACVSNFVRQSHDRDVSAATLRLRRGRHSEAAPQGTASLRLQCLEGVFGPKIVEVQLPERSEWVVHPELLLYSTPARPHSATEQPRKGVARRPNLATVQSSPTSTELIPSLLAIHDSLGELLLKARTHRENVRRITDLKEETEQLQIAQREKNQEAQKCKYPIS